MPKKGKNGKYHSKVTPAPGVKPIYFEAPTLREFYEKREQIIRDYVEGRTVRDASFIAMIDEWYTVVKKPRIRSASTRKRYATLIRRVKAGFSPSLLCRAVRYPALQQYLDTLKGECDDTVSKAKSILNAVCIYAVSEGAMETNYASALQKPIVKPGARRTALTEAQASALLKASVDDPYGVVVQIGYYTGMRLGEILGLKWSDLDWANRMISVSRAVVEHEHSGENVGALKTEGSERLVPMPEELVELLLPRRGLPSAFICPRPKQAKGPLNQYTFRARLDEILFRAGLARQTGKKIVRDVTMHQLRHHYATACYRAGIPLTVAMQWLGHTDSRTTIAIYTDLKKAVFQKETAKHLACSLKKVGQKLDLGALSW